MCNNLVVLLSELQSWYVHCPSSYKAVRSDSVFCIRNIHDMEVDIPMEGRLDWCIPDSDRREGRVLSAEIGQMSPDLTLFSHDSYHDCYMKLYQPVRIYSSSYHRRPRFFTQGGAL